MSRSRAYRPQLLERNPGRFFVFARLENLNNIRMRDRRKSLGLIAKSSDLFRCGIRTGANQLECR